MAVYKILEDELRNAQAQEKMKIEELGMARGAILMIQHLMKRFDEPTGVDASDIEIPAGSGQSLQDIVDEGMKNEG